MRFVPHNIWFTIWTLDQSSQNRRKVLPSEPFIHHEGVICKEYKWHQRLYRAQKLLGAPYESLQLRFGPISDGLPSGLGTKRGKIEEKCPQENHSYTTKEWFARNISDTRGFIMLRSYLVHHMSPCKWGLAPYQMVYHLALAQILPKSKKKVFSKTIHTPWRSDLQEIWVTPEALSCSEATWCTIWVLANEV